MNTCKNIILPTVLYECAVRSLTLREEHWLGVFENLLLRRMSGCRRDVTGGFLFFISYIIRMIKLRVCSSQNEGKASTEVVMADTYISWSGSTMGYTWMVSIRSVLSQMTRDSFAFLISCSCSEKENFLLYPFSLKWLLIFCFLPTQFLCRFARHLSSYISAFWSSLGIVHVSLFSWSSIFPTSANVYMLEYLVLLPTYVSV